MKHEIPAPGFTLISGKRKPPASLGDKLYCQIRNGWCDPTPWPVSTTRWIHDGTTGDVVAVKPLGGWQK
jgi:hypothetical protein